MVLFDTALPFLAAHLGDVFEIAFALIALCSAVCALTPTPTDDAFIGKLYRILEVLALNVGHAKDRPARGASAAEGDRVT